MSKTHIDSQLDVSKLIQISLWKVSSIKWWADKVLLIDMLHVLITLWSGSAVDIFLLTVKNINKKKSFCGISWCLVESFMSRFHEGTLVKFVGWKRGLIQCSDADYNLVWNYKQWQFTRAEMLLLDVEYTSWKANDSEVY